MTKEENADFRFGEFNKPDEESIKNISDGIKKMFGGNRDPKKQKITHSISPLSQTLIKEFADECGVTQGTIVELAPILFRMLTEKSIKRREKSFQILKNLQKQIDTSFSSMAEIAPHLKPFVDFLKEATEELCSLEQLAIESNNYRGVDASDSPIFKSIGKNNKDVHPAFHKEIRTDMKENKALEELFDITINS